MKKIFIDGSNGTTGLRIRDRLAERKDIELLRLPEELRKDDRARADIMNSADIVIMCLPDDAAREAVGFITDPDTAVIDTSTAHRISPGWAYGFPELKGRREAVKASGRIANPGCHASGFIALIAPLVELGLISPDTALTCFSLTGYSGGGKKMIAEYESQERPELFEAPRMYGISQQHKHLPEMTKISGLNVAPVFCPVVAPYYAGMEVTVPLFKKDVSANLKDIQDAYREYYGNGLVHFDENPFENGFVSAAAFAGRDDMQISVSGNDERILLIARFDNLGKGASGAAVQNMNILLGTDEKTGLVC